MSGKTIQIFLPSGDPRGMRIAEITTRIVRCFEIPRAELHIFLKRSESQQVGLYFLIGENDSGESSVYIGQTDVLCERLKQHNQSKERDFWSRVLAIVSLTNSWTRTHVMYLEWLCLQFARKASRYALENVNEVSKPYTPEALEADCEEIFEIVRFLTTTLGYPIFEPLRLTADASWQEDLSSVQQNLALDTAKQIVFQCSGPGGAEAKGIYTSEGFVVFKGSKARKSPVRSALTQTSYSKKRDELIQKKKLADGGDVYLFSEDVLFPTPSSASLVVLGRASNGWVDWLAADGRTLDQVIRPSV